MWTSIYRVAIVVVIALIFALPPQAAYACSGESDPRQAAVIAEGWVEQITPRPDLPSGFPVDPKSPKMSSDPFVPVEVTLRVERFLKGHASRTLTFVDRSSVPRLPDGAIRFAGSAGACGILDADPTGQYALIVFAQGADGRLQVNRVYGAAFGPKPDSPQIQGLRQRLLQRLLPVELPRTGGMPFGPITLGLLGGGLVLGGMLLVVGRRRSGR